MKKFLTLLTITGGFIFTLAFTTPHTSLLPVTHAANQTVASLPVTGTITAASAITWQSIKSLAGEVISILLFIAGFVAVVYLVYNGIQYITSAGNADKVKNARSGIINAVIGIAVIAAAYFIINFATGLGAGVGKVVSSPNSNTIN